MNGKIDIATGTSRFDTRWKNRTVDWDKFCEKLSKTQVTFETQADYARMTKDRQDEIKDIGGFVGGHLTGGNRKKDAVLHRQLVTLDLDDAPQDLWEDISMLQDFTVCMYSTHKHKPEAPRLRLVIPLSEPVGRDLYEPIALKIALMIAGSEENLSWFDPTTFEAHRLMYWPSTSKDGEFCFEVQNRKWIDVQEILSTFKDPHDSSEWPQHPAWKNKISHEAKKAGDPLEKGGLVGAFCRAYTIHDAIEEYLSDTYEATDDPDRYTYVHGSTAGGLVVYEDKFAYSHHGTDPTGGQLCNAFDLVRIHKYGPQDENSRADTAMTNRPSYKEMETLCQRDEKVRVNIAKSRTALEDFADEDWIKKLEVDKKGNHLGTAHNVEVILDNDPNLRNKFSLNLFTFREQVLGKLPWREKQRGTDYVTSADMAGLRAYFDKVYNVTSAAKIKDGFDLAVRRNSAHPVREYLENLAWDGTKRVDSLLADYLGCEDSKLNRLSIRKTLVAAVARVMNPGCKFDYMLTLYGPQGCGKSTFIKKLARDWFSDNLPTVHGKEAAEQLQGVWIMEVAELAGFKKSDAESIKGFISRQSDDFRPAYAEKKENFPRQNIFIGTTNVRDFLKDPTGGRRFWPVECTSRARKNVWEDLTTNEVNQIWAEALQLYKAGESIEPDFEMKAELERLQASHTERDDRTGMLLEYLERGRPSNWDSLTRQQRADWLFEPEEGEEELRSITKIEVWVECLKGRVTDLTPIKSREIGNMLTMIGWSANGKTINTPYGKRDMVYERDNSRELSKR